MERTLLLWLPDNWMLPYAGIYAVQVSTKKLFNECLRQLDSPLARERYDRIMVASANEMPEYFFDLKTQKELLQKLEELKKKYNYEVIVLEQIDDFEKYMNS